MPFKTDAGLLKLSGQPLTAVHGDLDSEWEPGLNPDAHETIVPVVQVDIEVFAAGVDMPKPGSALCGNQTVTASGFQARPNPYWPDRDSSFPLTSAGLRVLPDS